MTDCRVVDTNVLIVASAEDKGSPFGVDSTPVEDATLRRKVLQWLKAFEADQSRFVVLDWGWQICSEYRNKLTDQDYGWLSVMQKHDKNEVVWVGLELDPDGSAVLCPELARHVTDLADRKMVAAVLKAAVEDHACKLANACDTDWLDCADALTAHGVEVEHLIADWLRSKWRHKHEAP